MAAPFVVDLSREPWEQIDDLLKRRVISATSMTLTQYVFEPGGRFPNHRHEQEQVTVVLDGSLTFSTADGAYELSKGGAIVIPAGASHSALAGNEGALVLSVVSPARTPSRGVEMLEEA